MKRFAFTGLILVFSTPSLAWTLMASGLKGWRTSNLTFYYSVDNCPDQEEQVRVAIDQAIDLWNRVPSSSITLSRNAEPVSVTVSEAQEHTSTYTPIVICDSNFTADGKGNGEQVPAATDVSYESPESAQVAYATIFLNSETSAGANIANYSSSILALIMAHEMGHALGLGHSGVEQALMYFSLADKTEPRLIQDDMDGLTYVYPKNEFAAGTFGCAAAHRDAGGQDFVAWVAILFLLSVVGGRFWLKNTSSR